MHSYCHIFTCRSLFSPRSVLGIGIEDGENAERFWSRLPYAAHTRMMRPEIRRDFISLHANLICQSSFLNIVNTLSGKVERVKDNLSKFDLFTNGIHKYSILLEVIKADKILSSKTKLSCGHDPDLKKVKSLSEIDNVARAFLKLKIRKQTVRGTKKSAMSSRALKSMKECLNGLITAFNASYPLEVALDYNSVTNNCEVDIQNDGIENSILFWKSIEQLMMTRRDVIDGVANLTAVKKEMEQLSTSLLDDDCIIEALGIRKALFESVINNLTKILAVTRDLYTNYAAYIKQISSSF